MLNKNNFQIIDAATQKGGERLSVLKIEKNKTIATNGHLLLEMTGDNIPEEDFPIIESCQQNLPEEDFENLVLNREGAEKIIKLLPKKNNSLPVLNCVAIVKEKKKHYALIRDLQNTDKVVLDSSRGEFARFPNYEIIIENFNSTPVAKKITVNPLYLKTIANHAIKLGKAVRITISEDYGKPLKFEAEAEMTEQKLTAYLMPMFDKEDEKLVAISKFTKKQFSSFLKKYNIEFGIGQKQRFIDNLAIDYEHILLKAIPAFQAKEERQKREEV